MALVVGVLALQGAFVEHLSLLRVAAARHPRHRFDFVQVRTAAELARCDGLVIPGGESTTLSLVASRSGLLEPLRDFVKVDRKPTWGTCAGLILLAEAADATKKGGQDLVGGLDVRVHRNHFGRQVESFEADLRLDFLDEVDPTARPFHAIFIRAPVVDQILARVDGVQREQAEKEGVVVAPSKEPKDAAAAARGSEHVQVMGVLSRPPHLAQARHGDIVAVKQGNVFGTCFHPELTEDARIHVWWLGQVLKASGDGKP